jgi:hypothetical protein
MRIRKMYRFDNDSQRVVPPGRLDGQRQYSVAHSLSRVASDFYVYAPRAASC